MKKWFLVALLFLLAGCGGDGTSSSNTAPSAPVNVTASAGSAQATVTFSAPVSSGSAAVTGYTVVSNPTGGVDSNAGSTTLSHLVSGLTNGTSYTFTVTAHSSAGTSAASAPSGVTTPLPIVVVATSMGNIKLQLYTKDAPVSVANFLSYVKSGFYASTIFHRVIPGFMIQGGGFTADLTQKATNAAIANEATNGLSNKRGTVAMARTSDVNSATSQFFINVVDNPALDHTSNDTTSSNYGYAVFGKVIGGMDVVDSIAAVTTSTVSADMANVPVTPVVISSVTAQ